MSRLDSFIRRLTAQRDCLNLAAGLVRGQPGPVFEFGLGNGRTYDHLREICPDREIFVFERQVSAHPDSIPDAEYLFEGQLEDRLSELRARFAGRVVLVHSDLGSGHPEQDAQTSAMVSAGLPPLMAAGGMIVSDQELTLPPAQAIPLPADVEPGRYFLYRWPAG